MRALMVWRPKHTVTSTVQAAKEWQQHIIYITLPTHFHMHIQRHTHTSTHVQSAHKRNGDNQAQEPGWEGQTIGFVQDLAHTKTKQNKCQKQTDILES